MKFSFFPYLIAGAMLLLGFIPAPKPAAIDVGKDLVKLGISSVNMVPGNKSLNAGPLLEKAVKYAMAQGIKDVIVPAGDYYFDPGKEKFAVTLQNIKNVNIKGNKSNFIIVDRKAGGFMFRNCKSVGLSNIALDYKTDLPFTAAIVSGADHIKSNITLSQVLGRDISDFENSTSSIRVFVFRKVGGEFLRIPVNRMAVYKWGSYSNKAVMVHGSPSYGQHSEETDFKSIIKGDILSISERNYSGANAISFVSGPEDPGTGNYLKNVTIYTAPALGVGTMWQTGFTGDGIKVIPLPGRQQYISSNADGINMTNSGKNCKLINCIVRSSGDDGISISTNLWGRVEKITGKKSALLNVRYPLKAGQKIVLTGSGGKELRLTIKQIQKKAKFTEAFFVENIGTAQDSAMIFADKDYRAPNIVLKNNSIEFSNARGIYIAGINGINITANIIKGSTSSGIMIQKLSELGNGYKTPGNSNIYISGNTIDSAFSNGFSRAIGGIEVSSSDSEALQVNDNVQIVDNKINISEDDRIAHAAISVSYTKNIVIKRNMMHRKVKGLLGSLKNNREVIIGTKVTNITQE